MATTVKFRYPLIVLTSGFITAMFFLGLLDTLHRAFGWTNTTFPSLVGLVVFFIVANGLDKPFHDIK